MRVGIIQIAWVVALNAQARGVGARAVYVRPRGVFCAYGNARVGAQLLPQDLDFLGVFLNFGRCLEDAKHAAAPEGLRGKQNMRAERQRIFKALAV